jgi:hypothetical protein
MSIHLNQQDTNDWIEAVDAVQETASNTDNESGSKAFIDTMARFVRDEPGIVVAALNAA